LQLIDSERAVLGQKAVAGKSERKRLHVRPRLRREDDNIKKGILKKYGGRARLDLSPLG
jgi:hypothetical protein